MAQQQGDGVAKMQEALAEPVKQGTKKKPNAMNWLNVSQTNHSLAQGGVTSTYPLMEETREGKAQREGSHLREAVDALRAISHLLPTARRVELLQIAADSLASIRGDLEETVRARDRMEEALMECGPWLRHHSAHRPGEPG